VTLGSTPDRAETSLTLGPNTNTYAVGTRGSILEVKKLARETGPSFVSSARVKNATGYTATLLHGVVLN
jgi:hypothetical protein